MELWNNRILKAPPTYTYSASRDEVDIDHLETTLQDGVYFYNGQHLLNLEASLLDRIIYRMKRKFRNSKDFQTLEKVKKDLMIFLQIGIEKKLELLLSILPKSIHERKICLPTKNMMDYILVRLQGVGKILCRLIQMCKLTVEYYERRLHLGHFWRLALVAIGLISRIYILSLNIIKFTCLLYIRLLPFSHKLKNFGIDWLPKDYMFPKDLREWLNIEWSKMEEVIEITDKDFNFSLIDLVEDSEDDVQFCKEYIELDQDEDLEIIKEFKKINKRIKPVEYEDSLTLLRGFSSKEIDTGEVMTLSDGVEEDDIHINSIEKISSSIPNNDASVNKEFEDQQFPIDEKMVEEIDVGELILSSSEDEILEIADMNISSETIINKCKDVQNQGHNKAITHSKKQSVLEIEDNVLISSSDEELVDLSSNDSVKFVEEVASTSVRQSMVTTDFISFTTENDNCDIQSNKGILSEFCNRQNKSIDMNTPRKRKQKNKTNKDKNNKEKEFSIIELSDTPKTYIDSQINNSQLVNNGTREISKDSCADCILSIDRVGSNKRRCKWNNNKSRKKQRRLTDNISSIIDTNDEMPKCNMYSENTVNSTKQHSSALSEISDYTVSGMEKIKSERRHKSNDVMEHSFDILPCNTSTPAKKKKKKRMKNKTGVLLSADNSLEIIKLRKRKNEKIPNIKQGNKKINKNKINIVNSNIEGNIDETLNSCRNKEFRKSVDTSSTSFNAQMNRQKKKILKKALKKATRRNS